ncbi:tetratricopeptide repeat protein [Nocardiopsis sp. Huas11]|uniref:tetratricopeptide repeat protein n=1 Tax=Nocardiopsis sp. Huas11 TaxID=2183912 RepID=UPI000EB4E76B|nr:tetratricopeptide repeat protein [Nocardiopsis sp. Huas11]RKS05364.1 tetratricopeptide repeat protein [Nocardiopsis sp. Huas11]
MASPPDAHDNTVRGAVSGQLVQARDIHGGVTINVPAAPPAPLADVSLDPPRLATAVRGREGLLETLSAAMEVGAPVPHVLTGPGGFGKTTVAAALAERARADGWTVFWVRPGNVAASMLEAAVEVGGSRTEADQVRPTRHQAARWVWRHLDQAPRPWLLVIDNADRPEELDPENRPGDQLGWMRASPGGFVLVTSRVDDPAQWAPAHVHRLGELDATAAAKTLTDHAGMTELAGADELAARLGGVPLALFLAGRILATHQVLFPDARALFAALDQNVSAMDELAAPFVTGGEAERQLLSGVWKLSVRLVAEQDPHAATLLGVLAVLGSDGTDVPLRRLPVSELRGGALDGLDETGLARTINALVVHGLVALTRARDETCLRLHPLIAETVRAALTASDLPGLEVVERLLGTQHHSDPHLEFAGYTALSRLYSVLRPDHPRTLAVLVAAAHSMLLLGHFDDATGALTELVPVARSTIGDDHPTTLAARHHLAEAHQNTGRLDEAEETHRDVLKARRRVFGPDHPRVLDSRHQLAMIHGMRGAWDTAERESRTVLEARVQLLGLSHFSTQVAMENLAFVIMRQGDPESAEAMFRRVWEIRTRLWGEHHHTTAQAEYYVGVACLEQGDLVSALDAFAHVLAVRTDTLGTEHPDTRRTRERLAEAEKRLGRS